MTLQKILADFSVDEAWKHLEWLGRHAPSRVSGSDGQRAASEYLVEKLADYGFEVRLDRFAGCQSVPQRAVLQIVSPEGREYPCEPCAHIASTPDDGLETNLVFVATGSERDYDGVDATDAAVVTELGKGPSPNAKARVAARHGAAAIIFVGPKSPEVDAVPRFGIKGAWGNPTRNTVHDTPEIAGLSVSRTVGDELLETLDHESTRVRIIAQASRTWSQLPQPIGRLKVPGNSTADFALVGSHYDAWGPGMSDNAAGNALALELARVFAMHRASLRRDVFVGFWNGAEVGENEGSTWFADRYWDHLDEHAVAYFNIQHVALAEASIYMADSNPELAHWHRRVERQVLGTRTRHRHLGRDNEHPFFNLGLPTLDGRFHFTDNQLADWDGARNGWWWRTKYDTIDKIDRNRFAETAHLYVRYIWDMCSCPILPMDFTNNATRIDKAVSAMRKRAQHRFELDLPTAKFAEAVARLVGLVKGAREAKHIHRLNRTLMRLSRILTPAFETSGGRYAQDSLSHEALSSPIPAVHAMRLLATTPPDGELSQLLYTELLRERNRLSDALRAATKAIGDLVND